MTPQVPGRSEGGDDGVRQAFDERSSGYYTDNYAGAIRDPISANLQRRREWMVELARGSTGQVLELGSGPGALAESLTRRGKRVVSLDLSLSMLQSGKTRLDAKGTLVRFCAGRCQALPFTTGSFDEVIAAGVLEYVPELDTALKEIARVLRPEGRAILSFPLHRIWYERWANANARWVGVLRSILRDGGKRGRSNPRLRHRFSHFRFRPGQLRRILRSRGWRVECTVHHHFVFLPWDVLFPAFSARMALNLEHWLPRAIHPWLAKSVILVVSRANRQEPS